jgi:hypothetical protein
MLFLAIPGSVAGKLVHADSEWLFLALPELPLIMPKLDYH